MLPGRGLRIFPNAGRYLGKRQFSSTIIQAKPRTTSHLSNSTISLARSSLRPRILNTAPVILLNGSILRFQSTIPSSSQETAAAPPPPPLQPEIFDGPADVSGFDFQTPDILNAPETIGYLKSLGLDFGWGPTAVVEWALEHVHVLAGTPWWASIVITAISFRVLMFKVNMEAANNGARMVRVRPLTADMNQKMATALASGDRQTYAILQQQVKAIHAKAGIKYIWSFLPLVQGFIGYGTFHLMRVMGELPVPGWESGGTLWFTNLALSDPTTLLALCTSAILHFTLKKGGEIGTNNLINPKYARLMYNGFPVLSFLFMVFMPAGLQLSFLTSGILSSIQAYVFSKNHLRAKLGMEPLPDRQGPSDASRNTFGLSAQQNQAQAPMIPKVQVQKRVVLASRSLTPQTLKYEPPTPVAGSTNNERKEMKQVTKKSLFDPLKTAVKESIDDFNSLVKSVQEKFGTTPEKEDQNEAERYEKMRREQIEAEKEAEREERRERKGTMKKKKRNTT